MKDGGGLFRRARPEADGANGGEKAECPRDVEGLQDNWIHVLICDLGGWVGKRNSDGIRGFASADSGAWLTKMVAERWTIRVIVGFSRDKVAGLAVLRENTPAE